jgi:hypothetical protein
MILDLSLFGTFSITNYWFKLRSRRDMYVYTLYMDFIPFKAYLREIEILHIFEMGKSKIDTISYCKPLNEFLLFIACIFKYLKSKVSSWLMVTTLIQYPVNWRMKIKYYLR